MNTTLNDRGETVVAVGAPGSVERAKVEWPALIEKITRVYLHQPIANAQVVLINGMCIKRRISGMDKQAVLKAASQAAAMEKQRNN